MKILCINLGAGCQTALQLNKHNLRHEAFPFDWVLTLDFDKVIMAIANNFAYYMDKEYLLHQGYRIYNTFYSFAFLHDFPTYETHVEEYKKLDNKKFYNGSIITNYVDFLPVIKDKYERRIKRFYATLNGSSFIMFFRNNCCPGQATLFTKLIRQQNPNLRFLLIILHDNKQFEGDWHVSHVKNFYIAKYEVIHLEVKWWHDADWLHIFKALELI